MITLLEATLLGPLGILALSILFIVFLIAGLRLGAFFALILTAILVALLTAATKTGDQRFALAIAAVMTEFGSTAGKLGVPIAAAAVIGRCLIGSGGAEKIVRKFIGITGEQRAALALLGSGFLLSAPVFFDTVMLLLLPLARSLSVRTGKNYLLYVIAICIGGAIANGTMPPAPGPLFVAEKLHVGLGLVILVGSAFGLLPALFGLWLARRFDRRMPVAVRAPLGSTIEMLKAETARTDAELPGFWVSIAPVLTPAILIGAAACMAFPQLHVSPRAQLVLGFLGDKNIALLIGAAAALVIYVRQLKVGWRSAGKALGPPLESAGVIILVISAGGAYGGMIKDAGIGDTIVHLAGHHVLNYVLLAWVLAAVVRAAQGSSTVATITAAGIMVSVAGPHGFGVHPLYIFLAIGYGAKFASWMNDAGFWIIAQVSEISQNELLRSWSVAISLVSVAGLIEVLLASWIFPQL
jgi:GntP family gluconate:H+ symporter